MSWNEVCVGSNYNQNYWGGQFATKGLGADFNAATENVFNPATIATIASIETLNEYSATTAESSNCSPCDQSGVGICQVGELMFDAWNNYMGGGYTWCTSICGTNYKNNLQICADFLVTAFYKLQELGYTNSVQMMAMAATSWNGKGDCPPSSGGTFYPWGSSFPCGLPASNCITAYGATAGNLFLNSGYFGSGVFDSSITL